MAGRKKKESGIWGAFVSRDRQRLESILGELGGYERLSQMPEYQRLLEQARQAYIAAAEKALDDPERVLYYKGFRDGLQLIFMLVDEGLDQLDRVRVALSDLDAEEAETSPESAGASPL